VLAQAGTTLPRRDTIDDRIAHDVINGAGHIIESVTEAGRPPHSN
jgi:hypothetical protein